MIRRPPGATLFPYATLFGSGGDAQLTGALDGLAQKRPVAAVYAVEKAQGNDSMIQVLHAPKKFFRDVSVPFWARLRQRNVPSRP